MPLLMTLEINHPHGDPDRFCPRFVCDHCGDPIDAVEDGNGEWLVSYPRDGQTTWPLVFTHKACSEPFRLTHPEQSRDTWMWQPLDHFLVYLLNNTALTGESLAAAKAGALRMASL